MREGNEMSGKSGALGCRAAIGLILMGAGLMTGAVGWLASQDVLRRDPQGLMMVAAVLLLLGVGLFVSVAFRSGGGE